MLRTDNRQNEGLIQMLELKEVVPEITDFKRMKILGAGYSIKKYGIEDIVDDSSFYVVLNHFDAIDGLDRITDSPILFFAHDFHTDRFDSIIKKNGGQHFLGKTNLYAFLHNRDINHKSVVSEIAYPAERIRWIENLHLYERAQSNLPYFENTANSLLGFSSTLHSALSLVIGNDFIEEVHLYGMDLYIYQRVKRFDNKSIGDHAKIIFNANKLLLNYIIERREEVKVAFFN